MRHPFFILLISLASFGLIYQLISDPLGMLSTVLLAVLVLFIFYGIYRYVSGERLRSSHTKPKGNMIPFPKKYIRQHSAHDHHPQREREHLKRKKYPFKVIEGQKNKKNHSSQ